jgi:prepilin-type N-terminal cleavage/methylation domain-containing protein
LNTNRGFTLIEVLIAAGILACGMVGVAYLFSFTIRTNATNRQTAVATALLYDRMEEFRSASFTDAIWATPAGSENLVVDGQRFILAWEIDANVPRKLTVIVYAYTNALTHKQTELIRATTLVSPTF